jgi:cobalt/nickel transport system ATP-binding protein
MKSTIVDISNVDYGYNNNNLILKDINIDIRKGDRIGIVGPNGAGKTTLFKLLAGIEKPNKGKIRIYNKDIKHREFNPDIGIVFQETRDQLFCPTVYDDVSFGPKHMGLDKESVEVRTNEALNTLNITDLSDTSIHHLSGGQKRLVSIAGILAMKSKILIYDEPTSNLDMRYRRILINFIRESKAEGSIIASHDLEFILEVCNRVILLDNGKIIKDADAEDVLSDEELLIKHGLEKPHSLVNHIMEHHKHV